MRRALGVLVATAVATYKEWAAYRSHMALTLLMGPMQLLVQVLIWTAVFATRNEVGGFTLSQMLTYYGLAALVNYLTFDFADWNLQMLIHTGKFTTFALRPVSHCFFALSQKIGHRVLSFTLEFAPLVLLYALVFQINLLPAEPLWATISVVLSFALGFLTNYCFGILAFWLTKTEGVRRALNILKEVCSGLLLPLVLLPEIVQNILFFLPFQFITYVPVRVFLGSYELAGRQMEIAQIVGLQAVMVVVMYGVYKVLWYFGYRRFSGVGV